ncbi:MAG TPA: hypothetical protein ENK73_08635 [Thiomicrospira sp.]|nr:hypothetical protein [Thiomicrospira sp.]
MRFGTRTHLKATQAVRVAGFYAWLAQQAGLPVSTGRLAESFISSPIYEGNQSYAQVMQAISKPCPPLANDSHVEPHLNDVLLSLTARLQPGTRLIVISDFHDVDKRTTEILTALQDKIKIKAVWVKDMSETQLPDIEGLQLQSMVNNRVYEIANASQRERYQAWSDQYQFQIQSVLQHANVTLYSVFAHESLLQLSESLNSPNQAIDIVQTDANKTAPKRAQYA